MYISDSINNFEIDTAKFGIALTSEHLFNKQSSNNFEWLKLTILSLIGFAVYNLIISNIINTNAIPHYNIKLAVDDVLKFGTVYVFLRLATGGTLYDKEWLYEVIFVLAGFVTYDLFIIHSVDTKKLETENTITRETRLAIDDILKFSTMFIISRLLSGKDFDEEWLSSTFGFIIGLVAYDYLLSDII